MSEGRPRLVALAVVPDACPRQPGELGPRICQLVDCRHHALRPPSAGGPWNPPRLVPGDDTCALDAAEVAHRAGARLSYAAIGAFNGCSASAAKKVAERAARKFATGLAKLLDENGSGPRRR